MLNFVPVQTDDFTWSANINFSTNTNKLVSLQNDIYKLTNDFFYDGYLSTTNATSRIKVGDPIGNFFGYKVVDIGDDGKWIYQLPDGSKVDYTTFNTSYKNDKNKMVLGNGLPKYYAGFNQTFRYKNFDLGITMRGAFKFQILNSVRVLYENPTMTQTNLLRSAFD